MLKTSTNKKNNKVYPKEGNLFLKNLKKKVNSILIAEKIKLTAPKNKIILTAIISCFTNIQSNELIPKFKRNENKVIVESLNFFFIQK
ncbi:MAG: hypothetical protein J6X67_05415 [Treponema sp.]|nr:hypothetical protein [Treponema sp.]